MIIVKKYKPTSPGVRGLVSIKNMDLYKGRPYKSLVNKNICSSGRNNTGKITSWKRGGGHKRLYRHIDWKRNKYNISARVERIEYDPNRSPYIALLLYADGSRSYIIAPKGLKVGDDVISCSNALIKVGNALLIKNIPLGTLLNCVELIPKKGAQLARSAGCYAQLLVKDNRYASIRLRSGEVRKILLDCYATIGEVCKSEHNLRKLGKAGRNRWLNKRPNVRGVAMNPIDHPMGGGEGKSSGGRHPCTPWGIPDGKATRNKNKPGSNLIIKSRKK